MKTFKQGAHRLTYHIGQCAMTLSKGGYIQSSRDASLITFENACINLTNYYKDHGDDFLADASFVSAILYD